MMIRVSGGKLCRQKIASPEVTCSCKYFLFYYTDKFVLYRNISIDVSPNNGMNIALKNKRSRYDWDIFEDLFSRFFLSFNVGVITSVETGHQLDFLYHGNLTTQKIRKYSDWYSSAIVYSVPVVEYLNK